MKQCKQCHELIESYDEFCHYCGKRHLPATNTSNGGKYTGKVIEGKRGYFILLSDSENREIAHRLTQKEVRRCEGKTGLKGEQLAEFIASKTTRISVYDNSKYITTSASYDLRTEKEKEESRKRVELYQRQEAEKKKIRDEKKTKQREEIKLNPVNIECRLRIVEKEIPMYKTPQKREETEYYIDGKRTSIEEAKKKYNELFIHLTFGFFRILENWAYNNRSMNNVGDQFSISTIMVGQQDNDIRNEALQQIQRF